MECKYQKICGGCPLRQAKQEEYRAHKISVFENVIRAVVDKKVIIGNPVFISDGQRRRAEMTFQYRKGSLSLGFNAGKSHEIVDIEQCLSLTEGINKALPEIRVFLQKLCSVKQSKKVKSKIININISEGDIFITEADNGLDILLKTNVPLCLDHRMEISDFTNTASNIIRISVCVNGGSVETVAEKSKPFVKMGSRDVLIPSGTFLQASSAGQQALIDLVTKYIGNDTGNIADLFCGVGTFSYPLSQNIKNKITAVDSSEELLNGFQQTVNKLMIPNIKIMRKNLFKYPLDENELKGFDIVVFDPPRAGAKAQIAKIATMNMTDKPRKIIAISCNPHTFINDAEVLITSGYAIKEITMVDQFVYGNHFELVALFEKI